MANHSKKEVSDVQQRQIRVFVSSTFRDMHEERNYLVKHTFPKLRKLCEERGVTWGEVDLRWGINDEQKAEGKVLPICMEEIKRCKPYFIGLLGERYGWVPDTIPQELIERESWLKEHSGKSGKSVTELEILHGVLNNPEMAAHAFFYFRDPAYIPDKQKDFTAEGAEDAEKAGKLKGLKERIRKSGFPVHENYPNPKALGELVLKNLAAVIENLYPKGSAPEPLDREAMEHDVFAQSRAKVYIGRKEYFDRLDEHVHGDGPPLVILGESGSGKSALLANWALRYRELHKDELLIMHFIGATPYSADWMAMLRRIMGEFKRLLGIQGEIPDKPDALRLAFANWLSMAAAKGRVVLILDALNQLEDRDGAPDLVWLPPVMPVNIRLIVSTLPAKKRKDFTAEGAEELMKLKEQIRSRPLEELKRRDWPSLAVEPFNQSERKVFIKDYLKQYVKELDTVQTERIAAAQQTSNPLYLRALLEELRLFGKHEELGDKITYYLEAQNPYELYTKVVVRWEEDYEEDNDLVGESMSLIWASRRGLSEGELLDTLGKDGEPLPQAVWSPLFLAAEGSLVNRSGLLNFFHDYLRDAVRDTYMPAEETQQEAHMRLAGYFEKKRKPPLEADGLKEDVNIKEMQEALLISPRIVDELPWQLAQAKEWERLHHLLSDLPFFMALWNANEYELKGYWSKVEGSSRYRMVDAYRCVLEEPKKYVVYVDTIANLFQTTGHPEDAMRLREQQVTSYWESGDRESYQASLGNQALILKAWGDLEGAMKLHKEEERICKELGNKDGLSISLGNQANILQAWGDLEGAMKLHKEGERICKELGKKDGLQRSLGNQALILKDWGDLEGAMKLHKEEERICKELGNKDGLSISLGNQALILQAWGDLEGAMKLHKEKERICKELGNKDSLQRSLCGQALILKDWGDLEGAMKLHKEEERICKELGNKDGLSRSLGNQALILKAWGDLEGAMKLHKEEERICKDLGNKDGIQASLGNQALILQAWGDLEGAMKLHKEKERICRELGNKEGLAYSLANQAMMLYENMHKPDEALLLAEEAYRIATGHGMTALAQQIKPIVDKIKSSHSLTHNTVKKPKYTAIGNIICPNCGMESKKGATFCVWCKTWFK